MSLPTWAVGGMQQPTIQRRQLRVDVALPSSLGSTGEGANGGGSVVVAI